MAKTESAGALSPDGRSFAFVSDHGGTPDIWLRQVSGGEPVRLTNDDVQETDLVYAPDGESIYFTRADASGSAIWRVGVLGGQPHKVVTVGRAPVPSRDGRRLAYYAGSALVVSELDGTGKRTFADDVQGGTPRGAWSPDGRWLTYLSYGLFAPSNLVAIEVSTGRSRQVTKFSRSNEGIGSHAWLPDNRHLVVSYVPFSRQLFGSDDRVDTVSHIVMFDRFWIDERGQGR